MAALICSTVVAREASNVRSTTDTFGCGNADSDAVEFAVQFWQHETNALSSTRGCWDHGQGRRLVRGRGLCAWYQALLVACVAVDRGHEAFGDPDSVRSGFSQQGTDSWLYKTRLRQ